MCAVVCTVIVCTVTMVHMNRLQTLRECVYNARGRSCTCFTGSSSGIGGAAGGVGVANVNGQQQPAGIVPIIDPTHDQGIYIYIYVYYNQILNHFSSYYYYYFFICYIFVKK